MRKDQVMQILSRRKISSGMLILDGKPYSCDRIKDNV